MNYRELLDALSYLNTEQLEQDVTVELDKYCPVAELRICDNDVLDEGHPVLYVWNT